MYSTREYGTKQDPKHARQIAELCRDDRPDQRTSTSNSCEVMAKDHILVRWNIVVTILQTDCRRCPEFIQRKNLGCDKRAIEAIRKDEDTGRDDDEINTIHTTKFLLFVLYIYTSIKNLNSL